MRFFKYSLIFVLSTCALTIAVPALKNRKSPRRTTEAPETLPRVEETGESKSSNRTKKQTTTFCVEIRGGQAIEKVCEEPQRKIIEPTPPPPPPEDSYFVIQPPEHPETISYVQVPIPVVHRHPSSPLIIKKGSHPAHPHPTTDDCPCAHGPGSDDPSSPQPGDNRPGFPSGPHPGGNGPNSPIVSPGSHSYDCNDGYGPGTVVITPGGRPGFPSIVHPGGNSPGFPSIVHPGGNSPDFQLIIGPGGNSPDSPSIVHPGGNYPGHPSGVHPGGNSPDFPSIVGPGGNYPGHPSGVHPGGNSPDFPSIVGPGGNYPGHPSIIQQGGNSPGSSDCTCMCPGGSGQAQLYAFFRNSMGEQGDMMNPMPGMNQRFMDPMTQEMAPGQMDMRMMEPMSDASGMPRTHHHHYHHPGVFDVQPVQYYQPMSVSHPVVYKLGPSAFRAANDGNQRMSDMQNMGPMEMQRSSHQTPKIVVTPSQSASHLHPGHGNPCNEGKAKHWNTRSTDVSEEDDEYFGPITEETVDSATKAPLSPSQILNQMRAASPSQRMSPIMDDDSNVQMSVIGPGGQSYILGGGRSEFDEDNERN